MNKGWLDKLCDPQTQEPLELSADKEGNEFLLNSENGKKFPIKEGIPFFLDQSNLGEENRKYQKMYDRIAPYYNLTNRIYFFLKFGGERNYRNQFFRELEMNPGDKVLEISIGTGDNLPFLPENGEFWGLDISEGMLKACRKNLKKWKMKAHLFQGNAEELPFKDNSFDVVFHVEGINFFDNPGKAINEMIRVAKPGRKLLIVDETEKLARGAYEKIPFVGKSFRNRIVPLKAPYSEVPTEMEEIEFKEICGKHLYCLTFRKPLI